MIPYPVAQEVRSRLEGRQVLECRAALLLQVGRENPYYQDSLLL